MNEKSRYEESGVNLEEASKTVEQIKKIVVSTYDEKVLSGVGPFAAVYRAPFENYKNPVLVSSSDGVGTKIVLHLKAGTLREAGQDLVAMSSNDILTLGAKPLFFMDYIAGGKINAHVVAKIVAGIADSCRKIGAALIGGETAEMPGLYKEGDYDLSGFIVGIAEKERIPDPSNLKKGDTVIGLASSGPHSNGYSLIRKIMEEKNIELSYKVPGTDKSFGELVLKPTELYHPAVMPLFEKGFVKAAANITGGGFYENIPRILPENLDAVIEKKLLPEVPLFEFLKEIGEIEEEEMFSVFNMGVGFVIITEPSNAGKAVEVLKKHGVHAFVIGKLDTGSKRVRFVE